MADFYEGLPREVDFARLTDPGLYRPVPDDWWIGVADVVDSTGHVAAGRYKTVNMVGAAVISAVMNAAAGRAFPFVFGGDGASFAVPPTMAASARTALAAVARWALDAFGMEMRAAFVPVPEVRAAGADLRVARFRVSPDADYAMFAGGGMLWAEREMKVGRFAVPPALEGRVPDLTGLSCRWAHMPARLGTILSLVVNAEAGADPRAVAEVFDAVIALAARLERGGHPAPQTGPAAHWPPAGARLEAHAARGGGSLLAAWVRALWQSFVAWALLRSGAAPGGFDARHYARVVAANADFRKLDDGLKMTLDCDAETEDALKWLLDAAADRGVIRYGIATQDEAMMTCIVPSVFRDDHLHFIDGAAGGYTQAAAQMKAN